MTVLSAIGRLSAYKSNAPQSRHALGDRRSARPQLAADDPEDLLSASPTLPPLRSSDTFPGHSPKTAIDRSPDAVPSEESDGQS